jgi:ATP-dependent exoDNAse (exonuclease V) alpha subunit
VAQTPVQWAQARLVAVKERAERDAEIEAALERARSGIESLAALAAELEAALPEQVRRAVRDGVRDEAGPVARQLAEVRGLSSLTIRRLEGLAGRVEAERHARLDDLAVLVDLIAGGWQGVDQRLDRIEERLTATDGARLQALG